MLLRLARSSVRHQRARVARLGRTGHRRWLAGAVDDPPGWTADELAEHVRLEYSTYRWLFEPLLERVGFAILDVDFVRNAYGAYTCRRR